MVFDDEDPDGPRLPLCGNSPRLARLAGARVAPAPAGRGPLVPDVSVPGLEDVGEPLAGDAQPLRCLRRLPVREFQEWAWTKVESVLADPLLLSDLEAARSARERA